MYRVVRDLKAEDLERCLDKGYVDGFEVHETKRVALNFSA